MVKTIGMVRVAFSIASAPVPPPARMTSGASALVVRNRAARVGRNPATGEAIQIKASKNVAFRASKYLKMAI